jgi:hypothetical protein
MMEMVKAAREGRLTRVIGVAAAALWMGSAGMLIVPRTVHAQDDSSAVSSDNGDVNNSDVTDSDNDDAFGADAAVSSAKVTPPTLTGGWSGTADDNRHGAGTVDITFTTQTGNNKVVQGTWSAEYGDQTSLGGSAVGKLNGKSLSLIMDDPTVSRKCRIKFSGKVSVSDGVAEAINGKYSLVGCFKKKSKGTFEDLTPTS